MDGQPPASVPGTTSPARSRSTSDGKIVVAGSAGIHGLRRRALQHERHARHDLQRRRHGHDRHRPTGPRVCGRDPERRQDRPRRARDRAPTSSSSATTRTARSTPPSTATASSRRTWARRTRRHTDLAIQSDGKILAVGGTNSPFGPSPGDFALARYNTNGSLDTTFDGDGKVFTDLGGRADSSGESAQAVSILGDGRIVVAGPGARRDHQLALALRGRPLPHERQPRRDLRHRRQGDARP